MAVKKVTGKTFEKEVLKHKKTVVVDFYADWCTPCKGFAPILKEFEKVSEAKVVKIDVEKDPELVKKFDITSIPTLIAFHDGIETNKHIGVLRIEELQDFAFGKEPKKQ